jgi:hypothetical protein
VTAKQAWCDTLIDWLMLTSVRAAVCGPEGRSGPRDAGVETRSANFGQGDSREQGFEGHHNHRSFTTVYTSSTHAVAHPNSLLRKHAAVCMLHLICSGNPAAVGVLCAYMKYKYGPYLHVAYMMSLPNRNAHAAPGPCILHA